MAPGGWLSMSSPFGFGHAFSFAAADAAQGLCGASLASVACTAQAHLRCWVLANHGHHCFGCTFGLSASGAASCAACQKQ